MAMTLPEAIDTLRKFADRHRGTYGTTCHAIGVVLALHGPRSNEAKPRCPGCDLPLATQADYDVIPEGQGDYLCWRAWHADICVRTPVDWRTRALTAESALGKASRAAPTLTEQRHHFCAIGDCLHACSNPRACGHACPAPPNGDHEV